MVTPFVGYQNHRQLLSKDGEHWQLLRDYANDYPERLHIGIMSQSPQDSIHTCRYSDMELVYQPVKDFRTGDL